MQLHVFTRIKIHIIKNKFSRGVTYFKMKTYIKSAESRRSKSLLHNTNINLKK